MRSFVAPGDLVLCFRQDAEAVVLHVGTCWALAVEPIAGREEENWFCVDEDRYGVIYEGATPALRDHVAAIMAGRETTITARAPAALGEPDGGRLLRIKAGPHRCQGRRPVAAERPEADGAVVRQGEH